MLFKLFSDHPEMDFVATERLCPRRRASRTPEEAFERANNIPYGLSTGVWMDNVIFKMVNKLRACVVWANTYNKFDPASLPRWRDGYKESGFGREGGLHRAYQKDCVWVITGDKSRYDQRAERSTEKSGCID